MKRTFGIAILLLATATVLNAQKPNKFWSTGKLSWNDYTVSSMLAADGAASSNSFCWETKDIDQKFGNLTVHRITSQVYLNGAQSWVNPDFATDNQLVFNQLFFDLNELQCRKMLREMYDPAVNYDAAFLQDYYIGLTAVRMSEITIASDHGRDMETLAYYQAIVGSQLETLTRGEFNPKGLKKDKHGVGFRIGVGGEYFFGTPGEYISPAFVMDMSAKYYYKRAFVELQCGLGGLSTLQNITAGVKEFTARQSLTEFQLCGIAGFSLYDGPWFRIAPYAGFGYNSIGTLADEDDDSESVFIGGTRFLGGIETDIKFSREAYLYPDDRNINETGLNLRLYVARTGFSGGLDGYSLNFSLSYFFQGWGLKSW